MSGTDDPAVDQLAALTAALKALLPNPSTTLIAPTFDWNSTEQYEGFRLFIKSVNSWFTLQHITAETTPDGTSNSTRLEYVLNFLGNTGCKMYEQWKPTGTNEVKKKKDSAKEFLDYLLSTMDHEVSQRCRIYQPEDIWPTQVSHLMNLLTIFVLLLIDVTSHQKKKRNTMFNTDL